jgi:hypothetical protein
VAKKRRPKVREAEELASDEQTSDVNLPKRLVDRELLIIPEPPSFDLTILKKRKRGQT